MGGAGLVIIFVCAFAGCTIWSLLLLMFASHYFLTTIIDSSAGHGEVHYPSEGVIDWWWKPLFCLWILSFWVVAVSIILTPLLALDPLAYLICLGLLLWVLYPLGLLSALFTSNWLFFLHPIILWRMLTHYRAFSYVQVVTLLLASGCVALLAGTFTHSIWWIVPTAVVLPAALLFYARQWGRFAWLSLNFAPRAKKGPRPVYAPTGDKRNWPANPEEDVPEMAVEEFDEAAEGVREGLPPAYPHGIQTDVPASPEGIVAKAPPAVVEEEDEFAPNKEPYKIVDDPTRSPFEETDPEPTSVPALLPLPARAPVVEEEDEWATDKKPYAVIDDPSPEPAPGAPAQSEANKPITNSKYYDERHKKEKAATAKAKEQAEQHYMPPPSKKTPTFATALLLGVWDFMFYGKTIRVWANLAFLTLVELLLLSMVVRFWPRTE